LERSRNQDKSGEQFKGLVKGENLGKGGGWDTQFPLRACGPMLRIGKGGNLNVGEGSQGGGGSGATDLKGPVEKKKQEGLDAKNESTPQV